MGSSILEFETNNVYDELDSILIESSHSEIVPIYYRVFYGYTRWNENPDNKTKSIVIFIQKGSERNWINAKSKKQIQFLKNPHLLIEDLPKIINAINELTKRNL
jgi:hypothetical protein